MMGPTDDLKVMQGIPESEDVASVLSILTSLEERYKSQAERVAAAKALLMKPGVQEAVEAMADLGFNFNLRPRL
jgi:hypothetical protein